MSTWKHGEDDIYLNEGIKKICTNKKTHPEEMYFEKDPNSRRTSYSNCRKCFAQKMQNSCFYEPEKSARPLSSFAFPKFLLGILLLVFLINSFGEATTVSISSSKTIVPTTTVASRGRWCQKVLTEERTREVTETRGCSENYNTSCGFFSYNTCVYTRYKICTRTYNHTFLLTKSIMDCCPGWEKKDNDTCIELAQKSKSLPSIHELSIGTFAAICSAGAFIMVIVFFIVKAVWKKKRKEKAAVECVHLEQLESLNNPPRPQQPLIPPQPHMANPHSLLPLKSSVLDDPDVEAATGAVDTNTTEIVEASPPENDQEEVTVKMLEKIPENEEKAPTTVNQVSPLANGSESDSQENLGLSEPELQVELFIREEGDMSNKPESQTQLQIQTLPEESKDDTKDSQDPKV